MYGIAEGYQHRNDNEPVESSKRSDRYQREVYAYAANLKPSTVLDIGCGTGNKLVRNFPDADTLGLEVADNLEYLAQHHPNRKWALSEPHKPPVGRFDVVICADVVEHIPNPDELMEFIAGIDFETLIISTPARELLYPPNHLGPPRNKAHCREWMESEFNKYVSGWFKVRRQVVTNAKHGTQMIEAVKC